LDQNFTLSYISKIYDPIGVELPFSILLLSLFCHIEFLPSRFSIQYCHSIFAIQRCHFNIFMNYCRFILPFNTVVNDYRSISPLILPFYILPFNTDVLILSNPFLGALSTLNGFSSL